ncbi:hypothetical protein [Leptospira interrogans]|nr:hypothetical protein [Leptospira interrogans]MBE8388075.1 hypothetical protein [Leptospira interrogans serovar Pomona]
MATQCLASTVTRSNSANTSLNSMYRLYGRSAGRNLEFIGQLYIKFILN